MPHRLPVLRGPRPPTLPCGCRIKPTVFRRGPDRFFVFFREETRLPVHVSHPDDEATFWLSPQVELAKQTGRAVRGRSPPWPLTTWPTGGNAEGFPGRDSSHPARADLFHSPLADHVVGAAEQLVRDQVQKIVDGWNKHFAG
jgi:hypothetical protein